MAQGTAVARSRRAVPAARKQGQSRRAAPQSGMLMLDQSGYSTWVSPDMPQLVTPENILVVYMTITPELAAQLLEDNKANRPVSDRLWEQYGRGMTTGHFPWCGATLVLDQAGLMMDGQHRCIGAVKTGSSFDTLVVFNMPRERMKFIDAGRKRSVSDLLRMAGFKNTAAFGAAARLSLEWKYWREHHGHVTIGTFEVEEYALTHMGPLQVGFEAANKIRSQGMRKTSYAAIMALHLRAKELLDPFEVNAFFQRVAMGGDSMTPPQEGLRTRLTAATKAVAKEQLALGVIAVNYHFANRPIRPRITERDLSVTSFPDIVPPEVEVLTEVDEKVAEFMERRRG